MTAQDWIREWAITEWTLHVMKRRANYFPEVR